jgi:DmsE family decaheme c-type cytochrome
MRTLLILLALALPAAAQDATPPAAAPPSPEAEAVPACTDCHEAQGKSFMTNAHHRVVAGKPNAACESCHGDGKEHIEGGGDKEKIYKPQGRVGADKTCLACHKNTDRISRHGGMHANSASVNCFSCHSIHMPDAKSEHLLVKQELALCSSCHSAQAASFRNKPYAHRLGRGAMECSSCHQPHGRAGRDSIRQTASGESACASCHTDKRAMYVFPHGASSVGDCASCHEMHGSSNPKQLKRATVAQLCIECHSPIAGTAITLASQPPSFHNLSNPRYQSCTTCHTAVHGSNRSPLLLK